MKDNRGQAALEFLLTYGWAILVLSLVSVLLWQMGVFDPGGQVQPGSSGFWGAVPDDFVYTSSCILKISISNKVAASVTLLGINATVDGVTYVDNNPVANMGGDATVPSGGLTVWEFDLGAEPSPPPQLSAGANYRVFVSMRYNHSVTQEEYLSSGWLWGNVEL